MATHSSILAWKIPRTEEPGGVQSMGSERAGRDFHFTFIQRGFPSGTNGKEPTCNAEVRDTGSIPGLGRSPGGGHVSSILGQRIPWTEGLAGYGPEGRREWDMTEVTQHAGTYTFIQRLLHECSLQSYL